MKKEKNNSKEAAEFPSNITIVEIIADGTEYSRAVNTDVCIINQVESYLSTMGVCPETLFINGEDVSLIMYEAIPHFDKENDTD